MTDLRRIRQITVFEATGRPGVTTNPYIRFLADGLRSQGAKVTFFSWAYALFGRYDVMHIHWPEHLYRHRWLGLRIIKSVLTVLLVCRLKIMHTSVVWTVHNRTPHEQGGKIDAWLENLVVGCVSHCIYLTRTDAEAACEEGRRRRVTYSVVPHGHYRRLFPRLPDPDLKTRDLSQVRWLLLGNIRQYKGVERLIEVFRGTSNPQWSLTICGAPESSSYADKLHGLCLGDNRIACRFEFVPEELLPELFANADIMVLPYPAMGNSGAAILSLSASTPVLAPRTPINEEISGDVGLGWMFLYEGSLSGEDMEEAARSFEEIRSVPDLAIRDWGDVAIAHMTTFRSLLGV